MYLYDASVPKEQTKCIKLVEERKK